MIEKKIANTISEKTQTYTISDKTFKIKPLTLGKLIQISELTAKIDLNEYDKKGMSALNFTMDIFRNLGSDLIKIIAIILSEKKDAENLESFIFDNASLTDLNKIWEIALSTIDITDFMTTIVLMSSTNMTSQATQGS